MQGGNGQDVDVTKVIKPCKTNTIATRVWNKPEVVGMFRRGFFWSPKE